MAGGGFGGDPAGDDLPEAHEINVTPFIDVMLVLLIIFMVAAPLATVDVDIDLPASTAEPRPRPEDPVFVMIEPDLSLRVADEAVAREAFGAALDSATEGDRETRIFLGADRAVAYGDVVEALNLMRAAGYLKVALVGLEAGAPSGSAPGPAPDAAPAPTPAE